MVNTNLNINKIEVCPEAIWMLFCQKTTYATFFHTPYWAKVFCKSNLKCKPVCYLLTFSDGVEILLPTVIESKLKGIFTRNISMVAGTFGGFLCDTNANENHLRIGFNQMLKNGNWIIRENPFDSRTQNIEFTKAKITDDFTQCVNIKDGYEHVIAAAETSHRNKLRQAIRAGLKASIAEEWDEYLEYYKLYQQSISRWKNKGLMSRSFYTTEIFKEIFNLDKSMRKLWLARNGTNIVAGILCFYWNQHAVVWHGSGAEEYFKIRPNNLLYDRAIHDACENGFKWFDCNPSGGYEGVIQFKKHLGAQKMRSVVIEKQTLFVKCVGFVKSLVTK